MKYWSGISARGVKPLHLLLIGLSLGILAVLILQLGWIYSVIWALIPSFIYLFIRLLEKPSLGLFGLIIINYFIMGITRYVTNLQGGIVIDAFIVLIFAIIFIRTLDQKVSWKDTKNILTILTLIWVVYCLLLLFNPLTKASNWVTGIRGIAGYIVVFPLFTAILFNKYKFLKIFLLIWSILTLFAVAKMMIQKHIGFDTGEKIWLYSMDGARTHIIYSGIRYFSFFTDAAAFGCGMALSLTVFGIYAIYCKGWKLKTYYLFVALAAFSGMMASGTRAAIFVAIAGFMVFIVLSKQWKFVIPSLLIFICFFIFFKFTTIGESNSEIRRMRTAFSRNEDASYNVRAYNQQKMSVFMNYHPFGIGIGNAKRAEKGDLMENLPTDSSLILVWVETGIVGLIIFLSIFVTTMVKGSYDTLFRIRNKELRGILIALLGGITGMLLGGYGNEVLQQFPNGPILYICMAFIFLGVKFDNEIAENEVRQEKCKIDNL